MLMIKNGSVIRECFGHTYHPTLIALLLWLYQRYPSQVVVTSGFRPSSPGVHGTTPCRALDIRSRTFADPEVIADEINKAWDYDPERPQFECAIYHDVGRGEHIHLQVHNNTRMILEGGENNGD